VDGIVEPRIPDGELTLTIFDLAMVLFGTIAADVVAIQRPL